MLCALAFTGCQNATIGGTPGLSDSGTNDSSTDPDTPYILDASPPDVSSSPDAPLPPPDAAPPDAAPPDAPPDAPPPPPPCVEGDDQILDPNTGHCYMWFSDVRTWSAAQNTCVALDAHLVVSTSAAENNVFLPLAGLLDVWTGGNDIANEGTWRWLTGEPMNYTNWRTNEPNNNDTNDPNGEDCMVYEGDNGGLWDDRSCSRTYGFICERE